MHLVLQWEQFWNSSMGIFWHPIEYFLKKLNDTESRYGTTECEMLGCILAIEHWQPYLVGRAFDVLTDHTPNHYIKTQKVSRYQTSWLETLADYDANFVYVVGQIHSASNTLSCHPIVACVISLSDNIVLQEAITKAQQQSKDPVLLCLKAQALLGQLGFDNWNKLIVKVLGRLALPVILFNASALQQQIVKELHESFLSGHLGPCKLYALVAFFLVQARCCCQKIL